MYVCACGACLVPNAASDMNYSATPASVNVHPGKLKKLLICIPRLFTCVLYLIF